MANPINPNLATYTAPTTFKEDGSAMPSNTIAKYQLGIGTVTKVYTKIVDDADFTVDAQGKQNTPFTIASLGLAPGNYFAAERAVSKDGPVSDWSNEIAFTVQALTPNPPTNFSIA